MTKNPNDDELSHDELMGRLQEAEHKKWALQAKLNLKIERMDPECVDVPERLRQLVQDKVAQLAESMAALGLQQPITVWSEGEDHLELVAGAHRLAAAIKLDWDYIDCIFADDMTEAERRLWEVDENLIRAELSPTERGEHLTRRAEIWSAMEADGASCATCLSDGRAAGPQHKKGFAAATAAVIGLSKAAINRDLARTKAIIQETREQLKNTPLDRGVYLDELKKMEPEAQRIKVKHDLIEPPPKTFGFADPPVRAVSDLYVPLEVVQQAWRRASVEDRQQIKAWVGEQETPAVDDEGGDD